jgi:hypothetical protein
MWKLDMICMTYSLCFMAPYDIYYYHFTRSGLQLAGLTKSFILYLPILSGIKQPVQQGLRVLTVFYLYYRLAHSPCDVL